MDPSAILFVITLALTWMVGLAVSSFVSHLFLTIVEETGNGIDQPVHFKYRTFKSYLNDGFSWAEDTFNDWLIKLVYVGFLVWIWLGPSVLFGRAVTSGIWSIFIAAGFFWVFFPVGVTSSLTANSRWMIFWPSLFGLMASRPVKTLAFYVLSLPLMLIVGIGAGLILIEVDLAHFAVMILLCPIVTAAFFVYSRLLGRFAYTLGCAQRDQKQRHPAAPDVEPTERSAKKKKKKSAKANTPSDAATQWSSPTAEHDQHPINAQPEDLPPIQTPDEGDVTGYNVDFTGAPAKQPEAKPSKRTYIDPDEDTTPLNVHPEDVRNEPTATRTAQREMITQPTEREIALYTRRQMHEVPNPYGIDVVSQLCNGTTIAMATAMTFALMILGILCRTLNMLRPNL